MGSSAKSLHKEISLLLAVAITACALGLLLFLGSPEIGENGGATSTGKKQSGSRVLAIHRD